MLRRLTLPRNQRRDESIDEARRALALMKRCRQESGIVYVDQVDERPVQVAPGVPVGWNLLEVSVKAHPENGLGLILDVGTNSVADIWDLGGVAMDSADLRVHDRIVAVRCTGSKLSETVQCSGKVLSEALSEPPLNQGVESGWTFTVARSPGSNKAHQPALARVSGML